MGTEQGHLAKTKVWNRNLHIFLPSFHRLQAAPLVLPWEEGKCSLGNIRVCVRGKCHAQSCQRIDKTSPVNWATSRSKPTVWRWWINYLVVEGNARPSLGGLLRREAGAIHPLATTENSVETSLGLSDARLNWSPWWSRKHETWRLHTDQLHIKLSIAENIQRRKKKLALAKRPWLRSVKTEVDARKLIRITQTMPFICTCIQLSAMWHTT